MKKVLRGWALLAGIISPVGRIIRRINIWRRRNNGWRINSRRYIYPSAGADQKDRPAKTGIGALTRNGHYQPACIHSTGVAARTVRIST